MAPMRWFFPALFLLSFVAQQFSCCCGIVCLEVLGAESEAEHECHACDHCGSEHEGQDSQHQDSDHEHHFCVGSHIFFLPPSTLTLDLIPQPCAASIISDLLKVLTASGSATESADSLTLAHMTPQQRRALLCVYSI